MIQDRAGSAGEGLSPPNTRGRARAIAEWIAVVVTGLVLLSVAFWACIGGATYRPRRCIQLGSVRLGGDCGPHPAAIGGAR